MINALILTIIVIALHWTFYFLNRFGDEYFYTEGHLYTFINIAYAILLFGSIIISILERYVL